MTSTKLAPVLMVQGTASHAGKSTLTAAFCRLFLRAGYRVAPFKAQNMANNAAVTADGREVGRAQAVQAMAAGIPVTVDMNPILLKPQSDRTSQVIVLGKPRGRNDAIAYYDRTAELWPVVTGALDRLRSSYDIVVAEGAGSPAEINLERYDLVNMRVARYADAAVVLVGDIDRGGVFASLYGTWALLPPDDRARLRGFIINKFRGDPSLLDPGFAMLEERTGVPTLGVVPFVDLSCLPAEDALEWKNSAAVAEAAFLDIAVLRLPRVANLDEFQPLMAEPGVRVRWIGDRRELGDPDLIVIPGTKSTMADLAWLRERGLDVELEQQRARRTPILGICGGFQMLGTLVLDASAAEGEGTVYGLGMLPVETIFDPGKITRRVTARVTNECALWSQNIMAESLDAYEIHMGRTNPASGATLGFAPFHVRCESETFVDGCVSTDGLVVGTYMHGLLENVAFRREVLLSLARRKGVLLPPSEPVETADAAIDRFANTVRDHIDIEAVSRMSGLLARAIR